MLSTLATQLRNKIINKNTFSFALKNLKFQNYKTSLFKMQKKNFSSVYVNHRDTIDNNQESPFDFTEENYMKVEEILVNYKKKYLK